MGIIVPNLSPTWRPKASHPLNKGLIALAAFCEGSGTPRGYGRRFNAWLTKAGTPAWAPRSGSGRFPARIAANLPTSGDDWRFTAGTTDYIPTNRITYAFVRKRGGTANTNSPSFGREDNATTAERAGAHCPYNDGTVYWDFGGTGSPNRLTWSGYSATTDVEVWVFVAGTRGSAIYLNGAVKASQATGITRSQAVGYVGVNTGNGITTSEANSVLMFGMWDAEWTAADVTLFYKGLSTWDLLESIPDPIRYLDKAAAAAGGVFTPYFYQQHIARTAA